MTINLQDFEFTLMTRRNEGIRAQTTVQPFYRHQRGITINEAWQALPLPI